MPSTHQPTTPPAARAPLDAIPLAARGVFYAIFFLAMILGVVPWLAYRVDVAVPAWHVEVPWAVRVGGWVLFAMTLGIYLGCSIHLMSRGRGAYVEFDPPKQFVATGPFRWCRNPIALCVVLMLLWLAVAWSSTGILLLFLVAAPLAHAQVVLLEEPLLRQRFGETYEHYRRSVPRWCPRRPRGQHNAPGDAASDGGA